MANPIWQDYYVDLGAPVTPGAGVAFSIYAVAQSATIYNGTAFPRPGEANAVVRINDICADYIAQYFLTAPDPQLPAVAEFQVYAGATLIDTAEFYNNWSYDPLFDPDQDGLNHPVVLTFAPLQFIPVSILSGAPGTATITMQNGQIFTYTPVQVRGGDFADDFNEDFLQALQYFGDAYVIPMQDFPGAAKVEYGGRTWHASRACPRWVLYYGNAYGGWDALPVEGKATRTDALTRHTAGQAYDNRNTTGRGLRNYVNEIRPAWEFWTGWLTAGQSARMHNLLNATSVFLHDMESGIVRPVVLTNTATEYKDGRLVAYSINAQLAQDRIRR